MNNKVIQPFHGQETVCLVGPCKNHLSLGQFSKNQLIYIDGGAKHSKNVKDDFIIGDNDSFKQSDLDFNVLFSSQKDFSDLKGALEILSEKQKYIYLSGFSGGRLDHFMCVFGECFEHLNRFKNSIIYLNNSITILPQGTHTLELNAEFSLICFDSNIISLSGNILYPCEGITVYPASSRLLSNEANGKFSLTCSAPIALIKDKYCD
jgi:thiamine pyrophosphokinase